jgi:hypothetical protein
MPSPVLADSNILLRAAQPSPVHHALALSAMDKLLRQDFNPARVKLYKHHQSAAIHNKD